MKKLGVYISLTLIFFCLPMVEISATVKHTPLLSSQLHNSSDWLSMETTHFLIRYTKEGNYFAEELKGLAERSFTRLTKNIGLHPSQKITIFIADSKNIFLRLQPSASKIGEQAIGLAYPHSQIILLLSPKAIRSGHIQLEKIFIHELTHIILGAPYQNRTPVHLPVWFNEGLCMYEAKQWNWHYRMLMTCISLRNSAIPFRELDYSFPDDPVQLNKAYAQSFSLISFILNTYGRDSLRKITSFLIQGDLIDEALHKAIDLNLNELENAWKKHLHFIYTWIPVLTSSLTLWFLISLIFLLVYYQKKHASRAKLSAWEEEEIEEWLKRQLDRV